MSSEIDQQLGRAFFVEMLANGIPIKTCTNIETLFTELVDIVSVAADLDGVLENEIIKYYTKFGEPVVGVIWRNEKISFVMPGEEADLKMADEVGKVLYSIVTVCSAKKILELERGYDPERPVVIKTGPIKEDDFVFDGSLAI